MIKPARKVYAPLDLEKQVQEFWRRTKAYEKTKQLRQGGKDFYFVDGPPYTTGNIHLGTALNKTIKDAIVRWRRMSGYNVRDQPGYDMHGLPIEVQVERSLGITNKREIEELGIEKFVATCRQFSLDLMGKMTEQFRNLGVWLDWDEPYMTIASSFTEAAWWTIKRAHERGLLTKNVRSLLWCTRCETALAEAEIEYGEETDPSIYVKFPLKGRPGESLLIWTTTPWTLPSNLAVAVHPDFQYAKVDIGGEGLWILEEAVPRILDETRASGTISERLPGSGLVGWAYEFPLAAKVPYHARVDAEKAHTVLPSSTVTNEHTGLVHTAPGHGPEDFVLGVEHGLPPFSPVDERGVYTADAGGYAGLHVREANDTILSDLTDAGALFHRGNVVHRYGHCWRCGTPIIFRVTEQWFLTVEPLKAKMLEEIKRVRWTPDWAGSARQWEWTQGLKDWTISRQRYWGTPLPVWGCEKCGTVRVVGSVEELAAGQNYRRGMDLHRPWIDAITFACANCGGTMRRVKDVLDVWVDSGVASWAQLDYPRLKAGLERWWPVDFIVEGNDQTRGWFNSQMWVGVIGFDRAPYESVLLHGWVNGPDGRQMHRHLGNYIEPFEVVAKHGVDAFRLYLLRSNAPWEDITFSWEDAKNAGRTLNILFNVYRFAATYMAMDRFEPGAHTPEDMVKHLTPEDRWVISRMERVKEEVSGELERYEIHRAARALEEFIVEDLSRWYVKMIRDRTWKEGEDRGKLAAYVILHEALVTAAKLLAPFCPYLAEEIYQGLDGRLLTVHMSDWPKAREDFLNAGLEKRMNTIRDLVETVAKVRQKENVKLRWPVQTVTLRGPTEDAENAIRELQHVFREMANVKEFRVVPEDAPYADMALALMPDPQAIGKAYKAWWSKIATILEMRPAAEVQRELTEHGEYRMGIEGQIIKILPNMVRIEHRLPPGVVRVETPHGELFVDLRVTEGIRAEGMAHEVVRRIQQMRKEIDLEVEDYVKTTVQVPETIVALLESHRGFIARETRSRTLIIGTAEVDEEYVVEWPNVDGEDLLLGITPMHMREALEAFTGIPGITERKAIALFDAGYKTLASVRGARRDELLQIGGIEEGDIRRIREFLEAGPAPSGPSPCAVCGAAGKPGEARCWRCGEMPPGTFACPSCGQALAKGTAKCPHCGFGVGEPAVPQPVAAAEVTPEPIPEPPVLVAAVSVPEPEEAEVPEPVPASSIVEPAPEARSETPAAEMPPPAVVAEVPPDVPQPAPESPEPALGPTSSEESAAEEPQPVETTSPTEKAPDASTLPEPEASAPPLAAPVVPVSPSALAPEVSVPPSEPSIPPASSSIAPPVVAPSVVAPPVVTARDTLPPPSVEPAASSTYLVKEDKPLQSYALFFEALRRGRRGFCVTRVYPAKIREKFGVPPDVPILWLSNVGKEDSVRPKDLEKLSLALEQFIAKESGFVLIDGIEYLVTNNNFLTVLRLVQALRDQVAINGATLVLSVNPATLDAHQLNLLEKEVDGVVIA